MTTTARSNVNRLLVAALAATPMMAAAASGEFTFVTGEVSLAKANGQRSVPVRGTPVDAGDRITTGANGMAQLTMVDQARLSLRPATQFVIEAYPGGRDSGDGAVLSLLKGTLRTFTGLLASTNRDKFVMKTRVATVGIRGSGNILYACDPGECDESVTNGTKATDSITVNHTIEGSHSVTNAIPGQQGGAGTLITGPGQTVLVAGNSAPRYIPTPSFIANVATNMTAAKPAEATAAAGASAAGTRNFSPGDVPALPASQTVLSPVLANNGIGFVNPVDATTNLASDPIALRDIIIAAGSPFSGQATAGDVQVSGNDLRGYTAYAGTQSGVNPAIIGGTLAESHQLALDGAQVFFGRYENASLSLFGPGAGAGTPIPGSIHWIMANSGYPTYLSDVLTGTAAYALAGSTAPTNQSNTAGSLGSAALNVNFTARTLNFLASLSIPAAGANSGGSWSLAANNVPFSFNSFFASTTDRLVITNGSSSSATNGSLTGSFEGRFVGNSLGAAILGYGLQDTTASNSALWNFVTGVAAFTGPRQDGTAPYREGRVSDPAGTLPDFIRSYATTDRPDEVTFDAQGRVTQFSAPLTIAGGSHSTYSLGTAQVVQSGFDPETGMTWGRWGGGQAVVTREGQSVGIDLHNASLHYIFAGSQSGPVTLPLTGTATYDVIGSTSPTNASGGVGTLNSATLAANFTNRTVDASVNIAIAGQTWTGAASQMPIYRDQYFSAYSGTPIPGVPNPTPLQISCTPSCGAGASGSFDGFFAGRTGQRAGMMYNLGGNQGAVAFGRPGGGP
ncbi:MAG: FecR domain-containing protein [Usitatibacter sp.]